MFIDTLNQIRKNVSKLITHTPCMLFAEIILTLKCSQRCLQCNIPERGALPESTMKSDDFCRIINTLHNYGTHGIVLSGGEPLMHPDFFDLLEYTLNKKFTYLHILSNLFIPKLKALKLADLIAKNGMGITTSFDGLGPVADKIRGGKNVEKITVQNMEFINEAGKKYGKSIKGSANIVISQLNLHQVPQIIDLLTDLEWMINIDLYRNSSVNHNQVDEMVITDLDKLQEVLNYTLNSNAVVTPSWLLKGYIPYLKNDFHKQCPYISTPSLGSKFFIQPNGDVKVCIGKPVGNILSDKPDDIFKSQQWQRKKEEFKSCPGCWNTCYTPSARLSNYLNIKEISNILKVLKI
ncbi:MAG: radical SAM protein [Calditrichaceae bacterium]|nr:radical SAM protein [Calditrichaceae bacterium]